METDAHYGKRFSHKKRMSTIQMGCFLNPTICYESPFKIEFHKKPATLRDIDCLFWFRFVQKLRVYLFMKI